MIKKVKDLTGKKFSKLTVIKQAKSHLTPSGQTKICWECVCDCGNPDIVIIQSGKLINGHTKSCGCLQKESIAKFNKTKKKYNTYDLSGEYGIGYSSNTNEPFYFDLDDFDKIKGYCWCVSILLCGYKVLLTASDNKTIKMYELIVDYEGNTDHKDRNTLNNRKENLRSATKSQNCMNRSKQKNNTSGIIGVTYNKNLNKWRARINIDRKETVIDDYNKFEDAVSARLLAEKNIMENLHHKDIYLNSIGSR